MSRMYKLSCLGQNGFTLIEILVAMAVLSTSLLAVFGVFHSCSLASMSSQRLTEATILAEKLLVEASLDKNISYKTQKGEEGAFEWETEIYQTDSVNLAAIEVTVKWYQRSNQNEYKLQSLLYIPLQ